MSKLNKALLIAYDKGYYVDQNGVVYGPKGKVLSLRLNKRGYFLFNVRYSNICVVSCLVHRLMAYQKFGAAIFEAGVVVRHLDGNSKNNSFHNIAIGTASDNMLDIPKDRRILLASNPIYNHQEIVNDRNAGLKYSEIMSKHGIKSKGTISFIINKSLKSQISNNIKIN